MMKFLWLCHAADHKNTDSGTYTQPDNGSGCCCQYRFFKLELTI
jgi:hypothetical protein